MDLDTRVRSIIFSIGLIFIVLYALTVGIQSTIIIPLVIAIPVYIMGVYLNRLLEALLASGLIMLYAVLEGIQIYYIGILFTVLALVYEPMRRLYVYRDVYLIIGVSILMASYIDYLYRSMGLPDIYRTIYIIWGGTLVLTWVYIYSSPRGSIYYNLKRFRRAYMRFFARPIYVGLAMLYILLSIVSVLGLSLISIIIPLSGLYLLYRKKSSLSIAGSIILIYIILTSSYGLERAFLELDAFIRSLGGWFV